MPLPSSRSALLVLLGATLSCIPAPAQTATPVANAIAYERVHHLAHGINTSLWFAQRPGNYGVERLRTYITEDDLKLIRQLGFDHIRLSIDAVPLTAWQRHQGDGAGFMGELDRVVKAANADGLAVIVDIHPEDAYKTTLLQGADGVERFSSLWHALAAHYAGTDPKLVFFEIMNEPEQNDPYRWIGIQSAVVEQIRAVAPAHTIIASGAHYSSLGDLLTLEPLADPNIIYTFHDYDPFPFTHQGASWANAAVEPLHDIPYPSTPENVRGAEPEEPTLAGQFSVEQYGLDHWDAARIDRTIGFAARWSELHHVPIYCGEFGVFRVHAPAAARVQWIHDMRVTMEKYGIGWAMWDYSDSFGVVIKKDGTTTPDPKTVEALGVTATK